MKLFREMLDAWKVPELRDAALIGWAIGLTLAALILLS